MTSSRSSRFELRGFDSDNGSEFINHHVVSFCKTRKIQFTRGRPYKKDDNAHIEQKNWTHVRRLVGWERIDDPRAVAAAQRAVPRRVAADDEPLPALGEAHPQGAHRLPRPPRLRRTSHTPRSPPRSPRSPQLVDWPSSWLFASSSTPSSFPTAFSRRSTASTNSSVVVAPQRPKPPPSPSPAYPGAHPLLDPPPRGGGRPHPEVPHATP